jgi:hypothetical protein
MRALLMIVLSSFTLASAAFGAEPDSSRNGGARLRPQDDRTTAMIAAGVARSASFRALVDRIEASDVFVYVGMSPLLKSSMAGRLSWMTKAGGYRYLRAVISTDLSPDQIIASLAHELQHVVEVIDESDVVDEKSLEKLYKRIGRRSQASVTAAWETVAAQEAAIRVRRELNAQPVTLASRATTSDRL